VLGEESGPGVVRVAGRVAVEVLQHERHAGERPVGQRPGRFVEGPFEARVDDGVQLGVEPLDPLDRGLDQLHRCGLTVADQFGLGGGVERGEIGHRRMVCPTEPLVVERSGDGLLDARHRVLHGPVAPESLDQ
jgi:hypothetical protein